VQYDACLDAETLAALMSGELAPARLSAAERHLARCAECRGVLADAAAAVHPAESAGPASSRSGSARWPVPGEVVAGKYRVEELIGQGAMGLVFAAQRLDDGRRVALKVLSSREPTAAARLLREAQTCARLVDEHIVRVFDLGQLASGVPYLVMELLIGETLEQHLARGPVPLPQALRYVRQACAGLAVAHAAGVIHRDMKPSNLFLVQGAQAPRIKLLDFGMSKLVGLGVGTTLTLPRTVLGSPSYMSPEQSMAQKLDARTDIWSVGVILYELLTGKRPFTANTLPALLVAIATRTPTRPSTLVPGLPSVLDELVLACLEKDPARRVASAPALVATLDWIHARVAQRSALRRPSSA
jgi:eukaryotic-like serine/threonine-protein kinase